VAASVRGEKGEAVKITGKRQSVLDEAASLVDGPRAADYGHPSVIYAPVGRIWAAQIEGYFGIKLPDLPPTLVCQMLAGMKLGRYAVKTKRDSLVDLAGYARTVEMCEDVKP
jgi:hypothetical protein